MIYSRHLFYGVFTLVSASLSGSCPSTTPWSAPVKLSTTGDLTSNVFSAGNGAGFMVVWVDGANNAHYSFSSDGVAWASGLVTAAEGDVASNSDVFVAANATGFMVTWIDNSNNGWSSFSANNGASWSAALRINPNSLPLNDTSDVYVSGGSGGFVAAMIGNDDNAYVSFSTGTTAWSALKQVTDDSSVTAANQNSQTGRGFVSAVVAGNSCMLAWLNDLDPIYSAYFSSINPFSSTTPLPIVSVGFYESAAIVAALNGYFMVASRANVGPGTVYFSVATIPSNWATFSLFLQEDTDPAAGPWIASNQSGFMASWTDAGPGNPTWTFTSNNGFNFTPVCSILATPSTTIAGPVGLSANTRGFIATWLDTNDENAYVSFFATPLSSSSTAGTNFVALLEQKYGPIL
jgi:hypothetical protein